MGYTAIIYFHGMGSQRRHEEASRLIDALDTFLANSYRERNIPNGILRGITPRNEPHREAKGQTVDYIDMRHVMLDGSEKGSRKLRVYEAYWAPIMADTRSAKEVALWSIKQVKRPFTILHTSWRDRQRLRRAALADLYDHPNKWTLDAKQGDFSKLLRAYSAFNNLSVKRGKTGSEIEDFNTFIAEQFSEVKNRPVTINRLQRLASRWEKHHVNSEYTNAFVLGTALLSIILAVAGVAWGLFYVLVQAAGFVPKPWPIRGKRKSAAGLDKPKPETRNNTCPGGYLRARVRLVSQELDGRCSGLGDHG